MAAIFNFFNVPAEKDDEEAEPIRWGWMCKPRVPCAKPEEPPPFYRLHQKIPWSVAIVMGFQHCLAMIGGIVSVPLILGGPAKFSQEEKEYLISAGLITSGILSCVQIRQFRFGESGYFLGTGLISVLGTSFTFVPIAQTMIGYITAELSDNACVTDADCTDAWVNGGFTDKVPGVSNLGQCSIAEGASSGFCFKTGREAYGKFLGTCMVCSFLEIALSFLPARTLRRLFPPIVSGVCVLLIGISLTGTGLKYWGGGAFCADNYMRGFTCGNNGQVFLPFGSAEYVGLGFSVFGMLVFLEMFGSPFLRNCEVAFALLFGFFVAGVSHYSPSWDLADGPKPADFDDKLWYVTPDKIEEAPGITFLWVHTFPLGVYGPAFIPLLIGYIVTTVETIGDVNASAEASRVNTDGKHFERRVQGGLTADGICSLLACLGTSPPNTTFSQNSGVIALTRCANKRAGYMCAMFLFLFGIIAKISAIIASIPDCILGGMTTFLFVNIAISGLKILGLQVDGRRNRFIVAASLALGIGVALVPQWAGDNLIKDRVNDTDFQRMGKQSARIILQTSYSIGTLTCMILNAIIPFDNETVKVRRVIETTEEIDDWSETGPPGQFDEEDPMNDTVPAASKLPDDDLKKPGTREIEIPAISTTTAQMAFNGQPEPPQMPPQPAMMNPPGYPPMGQPGMPMMGMPGMGGYPGFGQGGFGMPGGGMGGMGGMPMMYGQG